VHAALILLANSKNFFIPNLFFKVPSAEISSMETPMQKAAFYLENTFRKPPKGKKTRFNKLFPVR
jgi:hypothetical protein